MIADYLVSYVNGSGGSMLAALLKRTVIGNRFNVGGIKSSSQYNDAHDSGGPHNFRILKNKSVSEKDLVKTFNSIIRIRPGEPVFIPTHLYQPDIQFARWPNARLITVLHTDADLLEISINGFFKTELNDKWATEHPGMSINWYNEGNAMFNGLRTKPFNTLSNQDISRAVRVRVAMVISTGYHIIEPIDDPRMFYVQYRDLITQPDLVMDLIEAATGTQPDDGVRKELVGYQQRQHDFITRTREELGL
jgi:hypothetical protein